MKGLYYFACYHHRNNYWVRMLASSRTETEASDAVKQHLGPDFNVRSSVFICSVNVDVFKEL